MKKIRTLMMLLALVLMPIGAAGCSSPKSDNALAYDDAQQMMEEVWNVQDEQSKPAVFGGMGMDAAEGEPGDVSLEDPAAAATAYNVPEDLVKSSENASSMMNAMMSNAFTVSAWELKEGKDAKALVEQTEKQLKETPWICTTPEEYAIGYQGRFVIVVYGYSDQVKPFVEALEKTCPDMELIRGAIQ